MKETDPSSVANEFERTALDEAKATLLKRKRFASRVRRLAVVGLLLVVAAMAYLYFTFARPVGSGPAGPAVPREAFAKPWTAHKVLLLGLGDSVTAGFGVSPPYSYFNRLVKNPPDEFEDMRGVCLAAVLPNLRVENMALSGSTSIMHLATIQRAGEAGRRHVRAGRDDHRRQRPDPQLRPVAAPRGSDVRGQPRAGPAVDRELRQAARTR